MASEWESGGIHWRLGGAMDAPRAARAVEAALASLRDGRSRNQKRGRRKELYAVEADGARMLLKVNRYRGADRLLRRIRGSKAFRELRIAAEVERRGIPTPAPVAAGEARRGAGVEACYLLVPFLEGSRDLRRLQREGGLAPREVRALARAFGAFSRAIHDAGIFQDDFAPNNFLVELAPLRLSMIDFERARLRQRNSARARRFMLAKIDRELMGVGLGDRGRFLRAYAGGDRAAARAWWRAAEAAGARLARRDQRRLARSATRPGRRFRPLEGDGFRGFAVREVDPAFLLAAASTALEGAAAPEDDGPRARVVAGGAGEVRRQWASAILLARRGLGPAPLAILHREGHIVQLSRRPSGGGDADLAPAQARRRLALLLDRLLRLGALRGEPGPGAFAFAGGRALLLAPECLDAAGRPAADAYRRSRALARGLLAGAP